MVAVTYTSVAYQEADVWVVQNEQLPGAISQVTRLDSAELAQREAIAFVLDIPVEKVSVTIAARTTPRMDARVATAIALREEARAKEAEAKIMRVRIARDLEKQGYTMRDIGVILGVSHQRVHQIVRKRAAGELPEDSPVDTV